MIIQSPNNILQTSFLGLLSSFTLLTVPAIASEIGPSNTARMSSPKVYSLFRVIPSRSQSLAQRHKTSASSSHRALALQLVNRDRKRQGLAPLTRNPLLNQVAQQHAEDMLHKKYFSHYSPSGSTPSQRVRQAGGRISVGENIINVQGAKHSPRQQLIKQFQDQLMRSPGHRKNILKSGFSQFGYGIATTPDQSRTVAVQLFGLP